MLDLCKKTAITHNSVTYSHWTFPFYLFLCILEHIFIVKVI